MVYISPSLTIPKPLIVQASDRILASSDQPLGPWRRGELKGTLGSPRLRMGCLTSQLIAAISPPTLSNDTLVDTRYSTYPSIRSECHLRSRLPTEFPDYPWNYPECARNCYDAQPGCTLVLEENDDLPESQVQYLSNKLRLLRPSLLMV